MKELSVDELYPRWLLAQEKGEDLSIIDVRELAEYEQAHIPKAKLIPLQQVPSRHADIPQQGDVYIVCRLGGRSAQAIQFLAQNYGYQNLINVAGGTMAWIEGNYPTEQGA